MNPEKVTGKVGQLIECSNLREVDPLEMRPALTPGPQAEQVNV